MSFASGYYELGCKHQKYLEAKIAEIILKAR